MKKAFGWSVWVTFSAVLCGCITEQDVDPDPAFDNTQLDSPESLMGEKGDVGIQAVEDQWPAQPAADE